MKEINISVPVQVCEYAELDTEEQRLVEAARRATETSYAPYSHFHVGAAVLLDNGEIVAGSNQENAAFSSGTCAERAACYYAGARYPEAHFRKVAIAARGTDGCELEQPISPCGHCRQALTEYEQRAGQPVEVLLAGRDCVYRLPSVASLLPLSFTEF